MFIETDTGRGSSFLLLLSSISCPLFWACPSTHPLSRYLVAADELQANFTGNQQRQGVFILPHAVAKVFALGRPRAPRDSDDDAGTSDVETKVGGKEASAVASNKQLPRRKMANKQPASTDGGYNVPAITFEDGDDSEDNIPSGFSFDWAAYKELWGETPYEDAVTALFAEYAVIYARIASWTTADGAPPPMTLDHAQNLHEHAGEFVKNYVRPILGAVSTPKIHKLLCHLLAAIKMHGNLANGNTSGNEAAHKTDKRFYRRTNRVNATFTAQIVRQSQGTQTLLARMAVKDRDAIHKDTLRRARLSAARGGQLTALTSRSVRGVPRVAVGALSRRPGLARLSSLLGLHPNVQVHVLGRVVFSAQLDDGTPLRQTLRAYTSYRNTGAWFDVAVYTIALEEAVVDKGVAAKPLHYGEVRALLRYKEDDVAVVCELQEVDVDATCPIGERDCKRFKWAVPSQGDGDWLLRVVPMSCIRRISHMAPDFAELSSRRGIKALPARHSAPLPDQRQMRYYENAFFPWD